MSPHEEMLMHHQQQQQFINQQQEQTANGPTSNHRYPGQQPRGDGLGHPNHQPGMGHPNHQPGMDHPNNQPGMGHPNQLPLRGDGMSHPQHSQYIDGMSQQQRDYMDGMGHPQQQGGIVGAPAVAPKPNHVNNHNSNHLASGNTYLNIKEM